MLTRYITAENGKTAKLAQIYTRNEHSINNRDIDTDALKIIKRLKHFGHNSYIVGGAVRDLYLGKKPKDFDIVTDAHPGRIRKLFRNSRIIGRRFRLVHIFFKEKIIEVSTFRASDPGISNAYGNIEDDAFRRDFSINSLYYCPIKQQIIDYTGGVNDLREKKISPVIPVNKIFTEDPVRIIRALKYAIKTGFRMDRRLKRYLRKSIPLLGECSVSRITEEIFKILESGYSEAAFSAFLHYGILPYLLPNINAFILKNSGNRRAFFRSLNYLDHVTSDLGEQRRYRMIAFCMADYIYDSGIMNLSYRDPSFQKEVFLKAKEALKPITPPNKDVGKAISWLRKKKNKYYSMISSLDVKKKSK